MTAWYNEPDPYKAAVLREAIKAGAIAPGDVDERSIVDVRAGELTGYTQCHFFAGGGFWSYALRQAGWPDDRPVDTGSCPCPSFSEAGKGEGFDDDRHLWPVWNTIICERNPPVIFGEQSAAAIGFGWLDLVCGNLEASGYAVAAAVLGAHSVGAPHRRQRLYFCADTAGERHERRRSGEKERGPLKSERPCDAGHSPNPDGRQPGNRDVQRSGELGLFAQDRGVGQHSDATEGRRRTRLGNDDARKSDDVRYGAACVDHDSIGDGWGTRRVDNGSDERYKPDTDGPAVVSSDSGLQSGSSELIDEPGQRLRRRAEAVDSLRFGLSVTTLGGANSEYTRLQECERTIPGGTTGAATGPESERGCVTDNGGDPNLPGTARLGPDSGEIEAERRLRPGFEHSGFALRPWRGPGWLDPVNTRSAAIGGATRGFWADCDWWYGTDEKFRPIKPGIFPLASRYPNRVGLLRLAGDAIVIPLAVAFIQAYLEAKESR